MLPTLRFVSLAVLIILTACAVPKVDLKTPNIVYKQEVVQGNFVSSEQVAALRTGMSKVQVRDILGTALLVDPFHLERWDYVFTITLAGQAPRPKRLTVYFKGDALDRFEGDAMPSETEFVQSLNSGRKIGVAPPLEATEKQLKEFADKENSSRTNSRKPPTSASMTSAPNPSKVYPPLEANQ